LVHNECIRNCNDDVIGKREYTNMKGE